MICCRAQADAAMAAMRDMMQKLKLTVNEEKTHVCRLPDESFDFLGYTIGRCYSRTTGYRFIGQRPSQKKIMAICRQISELTTPNRCWLGKLFLPGSGQLCLSQSDQSCPTTAPSVVASQTQAAGLGIFTIPRRIPA